MFLSCLSLINTQTLLESLRLQNIWEETYRRLSSTIFFYLRKKHKNFDLGTGGGLPGIPLSILGYQNVFMVDSIQKKIDFIRDIINKLLFLQKQKRKE